MKFGFVQVSKEVVKIKLKKKNIIAIYSTILVSFALDVFALRIWCIL